jgi:predicted membrane chloride channel (bestrophin family)
MSRYLSIINYRTLITLILSLLVPLAAYQFEVVYNIDLTLMSIAIIFPLVFTIRGAFRRREKALEHLSLFRASLKTIENIIHFSSKISDADKLQGQEKIHALDLALYGHLTTKDESPVEFDKAYYEFLDFIKLKGETITGGAREKIFRFLKDVLDSADNLIGIHSHRTPISLKAYCLIFIYIFPVIYTPTIINKIGIDNPSWLTFFIVILSEFILISLYNIQDQMEYPFDDEGLDDIKLKLFSVNRK